MSSIDDEIASAIEDAEKELGLRIPASVAISVLEYTKRKLEVIKKPDSYLPLLYENELRDHYLRLEINMIGGKNNVQIMPALAM